MNNAEAQFEEAVIKSLTNPKNGWTYRQDLSYKTEDALLENWRNVLFDRNRDRLKNTPLTDDEFEQIKTQVFNIRTPIEAHRFLSTGQVSLVRSLNGDNQDVFLECFWQHDVAGGKNSYEVVNQIIRKKNRPTGQDHRLDITLLISGIPVIHLELKRKSVSVSQAYWQIHDYMAHGDFDGFYSLVQIFCILNGDESRYFARPNDPKSFNPAFCFRWADEKTNQPIHETSQFIKHVLSVPMGHKLMSLYTIADKANSLLKVLRSYQIYAIEQVLARLNITKFKGAEKDIRGGYIWHTTGSGKTMTSFKTAQLATQLKNVDKVIFLADRQELVKQTVREYQGFVLDDDEVTDTRNAHKLLHALLDKEQKLIVTSIQKMAIVADKGKQQKLDSTHLVFIVDEAHRSTAGEMLIRIREQYPTAVWIGFTGTPIFDDNNRSVKTADLFGDPLHIYSVADGILDKNVLGFDVRQNFPVPKRKLRQAVAHWIDPEHGEVYQNWLDTKKVSDLEIEQELSKDFYEKDEWVYQVSDYILDVWEQNSNNRQFSAMLAVNDIPSANRYFNALKDNNLGLKIAVIYQPNGDYDEGSFDDISQLENAIIHYNRQFGTMFGLDGVDKYKDDLTNRLSRRLSYKKLEPEQQLDLVIVVWQLLTGFDAPYLNTLYLDKVLDYANLIQAFSRTNRVLNEQKRQGIIEYFRRPIQMQNNIHEAFKLYSNKQADGVFFVPTKKENLAKLNHLFTEIGKLFPEKADNTVITPDFAHLPEDEAYQKQFARYFSEFEKTMIAVRQQGFNWEKPKEVKALIFAQEQYHELQARYADLDKKNRTTGGDQPKFDINPNLVTGDATIIDKEYLMQLLNELVNAQATEQAKIEQHINTLFNQLKENDRIHAERILADVKVGKIKKVENFQALLDRYKNEAEQEQVNDFVTLFGLNREDFNKLQAHHTLQKDDWKDFGLLDNLVKSADMTLVQQQFSAENPNTPTDSLMLSFLLEKRIKEEVEKVILAR